MTTESTEQATQRQQENARRIFFSKFVERIERDAADPQPARAKFIRQMADTIIAGRKHFSADAVALARKIKGA